MEVAVASVTLFSKQFLWQDECRRGHGVMAQLLYDWIFLFWNRSMWWLQKSLLAASADAKWLILKFFIICRNFSDSRSKVTGTPKKSSIVAFHGQTVKSLHCYTGRVRCNSRNDFVCWSKQNRHVLNWTWFLPNCELATIKMSLGSKISYNI